MAVVRERGDERMEWRGVGVGLRLRGRRLVTIAQAEYTDTSTVTEHDQGKDSK